MMTSMSIDAPTKPATGTPRMAASVGGVVVAGLLASLPSGCAPEEAPLPPVVWEGESVRVRMDDPDIEVCGGTFEGLDRHAALVREALRLEGDEVVEYSIGDEGFVDAACNYEPSVPLGCALYSSGEVFTRIPYLPHEIVHAVRHLDPEIGHLSWVFEEGLATMFEADTLDDGTVPLDAQGLLGDPAVSNAAEYYRAGHLMAILLERHGIDAFRDFDRLALLEGEDRAFVETFGETKEEFAAAAELVPHCEQSQWWMPLLECDGEPMVADPATGVLVLEGNLDCGAEDVRGPDFGRMWTSRHFRLDEPTNVLGFHFEMPEDATLEIVGCSGGCPERFAYIGTRYQVGSVSQGLPRLEPGEYFLRMSRPVAADGTRFAITIQQ